MTYQVAIKNNKTDETRLCTQNLTWVDDVFWWTEGNMSCDCNRGNEFARANNEPEPDYDCGDTLFSALYAVVDGKKIILDGSLK